jgi:hypothetical protein
MEEGRNEFLLERPKPVGERLWRQQEKTRMWEKHPQKKNLPALWRGCQAFHLTGGGGDLVKSMLAEDVTVLYP